MQQGWKEVSSKLPVESFCHLEQWMMESLIDINGGHVVEMESTHASIDNSHQT